MAEAGPAFLDAGLITAEALDLTLAQMRRSRRGRLRARGAAPHDSSVGQEAWKLKGPACGVEPFVAA